MQYISAKVDIRYLPNDMDSAYLLDGELKFPLRKTDRNENCHVKRSNPAPIDYSKARGDK